MTVHQKRYRVVTFPSLLTFCWLPGDVTETGVKVVIGGLLTAAAIGLILVSCATVFMRLATMTGFGGVLLLRGALVLGCTTAGVRVMVEVGARCGWI